MLTDIAGAPVRTGPQPSAPFRHATLALLRIAARPKATPAVPSGSYEARIKALAIDEQLMAAVEHASPSLAHTVADVVRGRPVKAKSVRRAALSLTKYQLRMTTRATPFGLFAGVAVLRFEDGRPIRLGRAHRPLSRPDADWLGAVLDPVRADPAILARSRLVANPVHLVRGGRLVLPDRYADGGARRKQVSIRLSAPVRSVLDATATPIGWDDLIGRFHGAEERYAKLVRQLVEAGVLLTDLDPPPDCADALGHLHRHPASTAHPLLAELAGTGPDPRRMRAIHDTANVVQTDLRMDVEGAVPTEVAREAERAADVLRRLGTTVAPPWHAVYHSRFLERYGTEQVVPVLDLLNPDRGLGLPPHDDSAGAAPRRRDRLLGELLLSAVRDRRTEVVLDDALIEELTDGPAEPPASMELCVELLTQDWDTLCTNDFLLAIGEYPGLSAVGTSVGRFAHLFPEHREELRRLVVTGAPTERAVQLAFRARVPRSANVTSVPQWLPRRIPIGCGPATTPATDLALAGLAVGATTERLFLLDASGTPVAPVSYSALNPRSGHVPPTARFLLELGELDTPRCRPWNWGAFCGAPYAPRVRSGRTILAPARWLPDRHLLDGDQWEHDLRAWCDRWDVPAVVRLAMMDHRIEVNLDDPVHREVFRDELRKTPGLQVQEAFAGTHACEVLIPLYGPPRPAQHRLAFARPRSDVVHLPGGEWLYAKLYASDAAQRQILADHLDFADVDTWFFVRYEDPEPHLRLRFHGRPEELNAALLPRLNAWAAELRAAGLTSGLTVDTYRPEIERYGAMAEAEAVFHADSQLAIGLVRRSVDVTTAAHSVLDLLLPFGRPEKLLEVLDTLTGMEERRAVARKDADALAERMDDDEPAFAARREAVGAYLRALGSAPIQVGLSLAHMHCNRLFGPDRAKERAVYALLRCGLARNLGRKRHGK